MESSEDHISTINKQLKVAQMDKLRLENDKITAEIEKLVSEKAKFDYDLSQSKKFFNIKTIWSIIISISFLGFFFNYGVLPAFNKGNIEAEIENIRTKEKLRLQERDIQEKRANLNRQKIINDSLTQKAQTIQRLIKMYLLKIDNYRDSTNILTKQQNLSKEKLHHFEKRIAGLKPKLDSLEATAIAFRYLTTDDLAVDCEFFYKGKPANSLKLNPTITFYEKDKPNILYPKDVKDERLAGEDYNKINFHEILFYVPSDKTYYIKIRNPKYKISKEQSVLTYKQLDSLRLSGGIRIDLLDK